MIYFTNYFTNIIRILPAVVSSFINAISINVVVSIALMTSVGVGPSSCPLVGGTNV